MSLFDIIQVEDHPKLRKSLEGSFQSTGLSYYGVGCLDELKKALEEGHRAHLYIIDGNFPEKEESKEVLFLAEKAIIEVRKADPQAPIAVFSLENSAKIIAEKHGTLYFNKADAFQLVEYANQKLLPKPQ